MGLFPVAIMKIDLCAYSGYKIYPGHGKRMIKIDGRVFSFLNAKCEASHLMRRNQKPEVRKAQREQAIRAAKEKQKAKDAQKKAAKASAPKQPKAKAQQKVMTAKPRVG